MTTNPVATWEALARAMARLPGRWLVQVVPAETDSASKLRFLKASGRDFLRATPALQAVVNGAIATAARAALAQNPDALDPLAVYAAAGAAARAHILARLERGGVDVIVRALAPRTILEKRRRGLDARVGIAWGRLFRDLRLRARALVRRVG